MLVPGEEEVIGLCYLVQGIKKIFIYTYGCDSEISYTFVLSFKDHLSIR